MNRHRQPQGNGSAPAQVHHPVGGVRAPVVDANDHPPPGDLAAHAHHGPERQGAVRSGHGVHIKALATGGAALVKTRAVPGSQPGFAGQDFRLLLTLFVLIAAQQIDGGALG